MEHSSLIASDDHMKRNTIWAMTPSRQQFLSSIAVAASLALFLASLGLPALEFATREPVRGSVALCWGWWGVLTGDFPWFANPLYFASLTLALMRKRAMSQLFVRPGFGSWHALTEGARLVV